MQKKQKRPKRATRRAKRTNNAKREIETRNRKIVGIVFAVIAVALLFVMIAPGHMLTLHSPSLSPSIQAKSTNPIKTASDSSALTTSITVLSTISTVATTSTESTTTSTVHRNNLQTAATSCVLIYNLTAPNQFRVLSDNQTLVLGTVNFVSPTYAGLTVNGNLYEVYPNQTYDINNSIPTFLMSMFNLSYVPIDHSIALQFCSSDPIQNLTAKGAPQTGGGGGSGGGARVGGGGGSPPATTSTTVDTTSSTIHGRGSTTSSVTSTTAQTTSTIGGGGEEAAYVSVTNSSMDGGQTTDLIGTIANGQGPYTYDFQVYDTDTGTEVLNQQNTQISASSYAFAWKPTGLSAGEYSMRAAITDASGNEELSAFSYINYSDAPYSTIGSCSSPPCSATYGSTVEVSILPVGGTYPQTCELYNSTSSRNLGSVQVSSSSDPALMDITATSSAELESICTDSATTPVTTTSDSLQLIVDSGSTTSTTTRSTTVSTSVLSTTIPITTTILQDSACPNQNYEGDGSSVTLSFAQIVACAEYAGFTGTQLIQIVSIAYQESSYEPGVTGAGIVEGCSAEGILQEGECTKVGEEYLLSNYDPSTCSTFAGGTDWSSIYYNPTCAFQWAYAFINSDSAVGCGGAVPFCFWGSFTSGAYCKFAPPSYSGYDCPQGENEENFDWNSV